MSFSHLLTRVLWITPLVLQAAIAVVMHRRRLVMIFPVFFAYTATVLSREVFLLVLKYPSNLYAMVYWSGEALAVLLGLGVILETLQHVLPQQPFMKIPLRLLWTVLSIAAVTAMVLLMMAQRGTTADRGYEFIILTERSVRFLQASVLVVVIIFMSRLGLDWHHHAVGIIAGFGVYSALALILLEFRSHLHILRDSLLVLLNSGAYNVAAIIWAYYFLWGWQSPRVGYLPHTDLTDWSEAINHYLDQWHRHS